MAYTFRHGDRPLEGYTIQRAVGRGGFGEVYYALADSGKQVALKYLRENADVELRGIAHVMNLKSPHLVTIYDVRQTAENDPFVVMEYISGPSLRDLLNAEPDGLGAAKSAYFLAEIAKGLSYLHERGIVHRDLKPGNIFYDDGYVKIGDYGLSKHISVSKHSGQTASVGTVHYMAPEIGSGSYTKAIDIYAMGVIVYEMLTGKLPFSGSSMGEILMRHLSERPDVSGVPEPFRHVIAKALAKDPNERYADVNAMVDEITAEVDLSRSMQSFDPATLSRVPRSDAPDEPTRTQGGAVRPPPLPPMDVHGLDMEDAPLRLRKKADKLNRKLKKKMAKFEARVGARRKKWGPAEEQDRPRAPRQEQPRAARAGDAPHAPEIEPGDPKRGQQIFVVLLVMAGVAAALGFLSRGERGMPESAVALGLYMAGGTFGALLGYFFLLKRSLSESGFFERLAMAGAAAAFMLPAAIFSNSEVRANFEELIYPVIAAILLCDWSERIEMGRRRVVEAGQAFWPAVIGLIVGAMVDAPVWTAAGLCASVALFTQAGAAALRPVALGNGGRTNGRRTRGLRDEVTTAAEEVTDGVRRVIGEVRDDFRRTFKRDDVDENAEAAEVVEDGDEPAAGVAVKIGRPVGLRVTSGVLAVAALAGAVSCFIVLLASGRLNHEEEAGLLFGTLAGIALQPFLLKKAFQKHRQPLWRGTLRFGAVSGGLLLSAGMIAIISMLRLDDVELGFSIFGLCAGGLLAITSLAIPGSKNYVPAATPAPHVSRRRRRRDARLRHHDREQGLEIVGAAPSFVGRTASAGLSALGKMLLLLGLLTAVLYAGLKFNIGREHDGLAYESGRVIVRDSYPDDTIRTEAFDVPPIVPLVPLALGTLCLVVARRNDGAAHFARGFVACGFAIVGAIFAIVPAREGLQVLLSGTPDWSKFEDGGVFVPLVAAGVFLAIAVGLLFWPKDGHSRPRRRIVV
jgi:hypothetical protein